MQRVAGDLGVYCPPEEPSLQVRYTERLLRPDPPPYRRQCARCSRRAPITPRSEEYFAAMIPPCRFWPIRCRPACRRLDSAISPDLHGVGGSPGGKVRTKDP